MTDDILAQAEKLSTYQIRHKQFSIDEFGNARMNRETFEYFWACSALFPQLLAKAKKWKAKAIEERAINLVESHDDICDPCEDCQCGYKFEKCPAKDYFLQKAARELEEEMKDV